MTEEVPLGGEAAEAAVDEEKPVVLVQGEIDETQQQSLVASLSGLATVLPQIPEVEKRLEDLRRAAVACVVEAMSTYLPGAEVNTQTVAKLMDQALGKMAERDTIWSNSAVIVSQRFESEEGLPGQLEMNPLTVQGVQVGLRSKLMGQVLSVTLLLSPAPASVE